MMSKHTLALIALVTALAGASSTDAGQLVQEGSLGGGKGSSTQQVDLDQFDDDGGRLQLDVVQMDLLTSTIGGGQSNGTGIPTEIDVVLRATYLLSGTTLAYTQAVIDTTIQNTGGASFTLFDTDTEQVLIEDPADQAAWIGPGLITLDVQTQFSINEDPPGSTGFSAGGTVSYTVTYLFHILGDLDDNGVVDTADLLGLLAAWGPCPGCPADVDGDGIVGILDLLQLLANWG